MAHVLTDDQVWVMLNAPDVPDAVLARAFGVSDHAIYHRRWRLSRRPWSCLVSFGVCRHCGDPLTRRGRFPSHAYHAACRAAAKSLVQHRLDEQRPVAPDAIAKLHVWDSAAQEQSRPGATSHAQPWTEDDDLLLIAHWNDGYVALASRLGRTVASIKWRRHVISRAGRSPHA